LQSQTKVCTILELFTLKEKHERLFERFD
jgi:hypothetical protein